MTADPAAYLVNVASTVPVHCTKPASGSNSGHLQHCLPLIFIKSISKSRLYLHLSRLSTLYPCSSSPAPSLQAANMDALYVLRRLLFCALLVCNGCYGHLPGHMQPLGSHRDPEPVRRIDHMPSPTEFYEDFMKPKVPVIFEGLLLEEEVLHNWQSDDYLRYVWTRVVLCITRVLCPIGV